MPKTTRIKWEKDAKKEDYKAAISYLSLIYKEADAKDFVKKLKDAAITEFKSGDIFRASALPLLKRTNSDVKKDQSRIKSKKQLSPLLLVRDPSLGKLVIADGYHRLCAVYLVDEEAAIACKIV
jgi:hypothetical protein